MKTKAVFFLIAAVAIAAVLKKGSTMRTSKAGQDKIKNTEGLSLTAYIDAGGWSIGYGHYMGEKPVYTTITVEKANQLFAQDLAKAEASINNSVTVPLNQNQFDALASFVYNVGVSDFESSTLLRTLNTGDYKGAVAQFARWNHSSGKVNPVLTARRTSEAAQFVA